MKLDLEKSGSWIGIGGMAMALFLYGHSAFVVHDLVSIVVLPLFWVFLFVLGCRWFMTHPHRVLVLPVLAIAVWFAVRLA